MRVISQAPLPRIIQKHEKPKIQEGTATRFEVAALTIPSRLAGSGGTESLGSSPHIVVKSSVYSRKGSMGMEHISPLKTGNYRFSSRKLSEKPRVLKGDDQTEDSRLFIYSKAAHYGSLKKGKNRQNSIQRNAWLPGSMKKLDQEEEYRSSSVPRSMKYHNKFFN